MPLNILVLLSNKAVIWWKTICSGDKHKMHKLPGQAAGARCSVHGSKHPDMHSSELENLHHFQTPLAGLRASLGSAKPFLVPRSQGCTAELCFPAWEEQWDSIICCSLLLVVLILPSPQSWRAPCSLSTDIPDFAWQSRKQGFTEKTSGRFPVSSLILTWLSGWRCLCLGYKHKDLLPLPSTS